jgi:hypothetical protein
MSDVEATYDHTDLTRLSYSGAKLLLDPGGPAKYLAKMTAPRVEKREYDLGHAVHRKVLGKGADIVVFDHKSWQTNAAKADKAATYDAGRIPVLTEQAVRIDAAAEAVLAHPTARRIYETGDAERVVLWHADDGTPMRGQVDWTNWDLEILNDLKTATDASPAAFSRACANFGYAIQAACYLETSGDEWAWTWTVAELEPPYLTAVYEPDAEMLAYGRARLQRARDVWNACRESDEWPGLPGDISFISLPRWAAA